MKISYHDSDYKGACASIPSVLVGNKFVAYDGTKLVSILVEQVGFATPIPGIVSSQIEDAIKAMEAVGVSECYVVRNINHEDVYCCWSQDRVLPARVTKTVEL